MEGNRQEYCVCIFIMSATAASTPTLGMKGLKDLSLATPLWTACGLFHCGLLTLLRIAGRKRGY